MYQYIDKPGPTGRRRVNKIEAICPIGNFALFVFY